MAIIPVPNCEAKPVTGIDDGEDQLFTDDFELEEDVQAPTKDVSFSKYPEVINQVSNVYVVTNSASLDIREVSNLNPTEENGVNLELNNESTRGIQFRSQTDNDSNQRKVVAQPEVKSYNVGFNKTSVNLGDINSWPDWMRAFSAEIIGLAEDMKEKN